MQDICSFVLDKTRKTCGQKIILPRENHESTLMDGSKCLGVFLIGCLKTR